MNIYVFSLLSIIIITALLLYILYMYFIRPLINDIAEKTEDDITKEIKGFIKNEADKRIKELRPEIESMVKDKIDATEEEIRTEIDTIESEIREKVNNEVDTIEAEIREKVNNEVETIEAEIRADIDEEVEKVKRIAKVQAKASVNQRLSDELRKIGLAKRSGSGCVIGAQCASGKCRNLKCK